MNIPNALTIVRFILVPILGYYIYEELYVIAILVFLLAGLTDVLDGYIARKYKMVTAFGKLADPVADKLIQITALGLLAIQRLVPLYVIIIVLIKEVLMIIGSIFLYKKENFVVYATWHGKVATIVFYLAIVVTIVLRIMKINSPIADFIIILALIMTLYAFFVYFLRFLEIKNSDAAKIK